MDKRILGPRNGYISELLVLADLLRRGYEVYGAHRIGNTYDYLVVKGRKILKIEVKTSPRLKSLPIMWRKHPDVVALVNSEGSILYLPPKKIL